MYYVWYISNKILEIYIINVKIPCKIIIWNKEKYLSIKPDNILEVYL